MVARGLTMKALALVLSIFVASVGATEVATQRERTFLMVKPDGVQRGLVGKVISRLERKGFQMVGAKMMMPSVSLVEEHYAEHKGKPFIQPIVNYISKGPVFAMVWEGNDVITISRAMIGHNNPLQSSPGTIRGDFTVDVGRNIIHGSDSAESAAREIDLWFKPEELVAWTPAMMEHLYPQ